MHRKNEKKLMNLGVIISALVGLVAAVVSAYLGYLSITFQVGLPISVTQTAEAKLTALAFVGTPTPTATIITTPIPLTPIPQSVQTQVADLHNEVAMLRQEVDSLAQEVSSLNSNSDVSAIRSDLNALDERLSTIEQAILDNPGRALALTLLSRDMENLREAYQTDLETTRQEVGRIYDFNKWFIGLMFTMALGLLSLAVSNFLKKPEKPEERKQQKVAEKKEEASTEQKAG